MRTHNNLFLLGQAPVFKALCDLGIPIMIGMLINALYNLADAYFVSGLGESQMGAISIVFPLGQVLTGIGLMFGTGAASYASRLLGRGNTETASQAASTALYSSLLTAALFILCTLFFLQPILTLLGATATMLPFALSYAHIYVPSCLLNVFNVTMNNLTSSEGAAKTAMYALLSGALLNLILDPLFIYAFNFGITGAAAATLVGQIVSMLIYLRHILQKKTVFSFALKHFLSTRQMMAEILKIGIPTLAFQVLASLAIALTNRAAMHYGDAAIAAIGAVTRITTVGTLIVFGFLKGFQPLAGFSYGARDFSRLRQAIKAALLISTLFCIAVGLLAAVFSQAIVSVFAGSNTEMLAIGQTALIANSLSFMLFGFYTVYASLFLALGKGRAGLFLSTCRQGICFVPLILFLPFYWGINGILYAQPLADILSAILTAFMAHRLHKELNRMEQETHTAPSQRLG